MKSNIKRKNFPASPAEWEAVIAAAPGKDRALTAKEEAAMAHAVVVKSGGYAAVRAARMVEKNLRDATYQTKNRSHQRFQSDAACSFKPSALTTLRIVSKPGLRSPVKAW